MKKIIILLLISLSYSGLNAQTQDITLWHNKQRSVRYHPEGTDFVITNGNRRFVRAIYGTNTAFRVEAGDLPEFALYMPGMGGNFKFGLIAGSQSKWLIDADSIKATYRPGSMLYEIKDRLLGKGTLNITVLATANAEGMIIKTTHTGLPAGIELVWVFGGATGKKFSRDGDIGADPESSFYLQQENCRDNAFKIQGNKFHLLYGSGKVLTEEEQYEIRHLQTAEQPVAAIKNLKQIAGMFPPDAQLKLADASAQTTPVSLYNSAVSVAPVITGKMQLKDKENFFVIHNAADTLAESYNTLSVYFNMAEFSRKKLARRVQINTPDKYINTIGGALSIAADAIWEDPSYLHGAVAWRMRLNAWRGAYVADPLGWHDRAKKHFSSYALSQVTTPPVTGVVMDTALHLARHQEKIGTALFSDGYICRNPNGDIRAHHYDMNLVFVDQLLNHFNWTGDTAYVKEMWPLIKRHLAWEKRNFDADGDGLYDAYAAIWASDALQYSGGGVTHSSAYNYKANKTAAELARLIGEDGTAYQQEADKILTAIQKELWLPSQGSYAEYKDLLGNKLVHPSPGLWTIYHAIDSKVPDPFQAYQNLHYVDKRIPHIPVNAKGWKEKGLYVLSTTNWQPYTWSINNVALAENLHMALAYWQGNRPEEAWQLWRSNILESMYLSSSPGGFEQLSFYDAIRGELYRDFADPIGMAGRSLVEGLFGIQPDALHDTLTIQPGYPVQWNYAKLEIPDIRFNFKRTGATDTYIIKQSFTKKLFLKLLLSAHHDNIAQVTVNGKPVKWIMMPASVGHPMLKINAPAIDEYTISITWKGNPIAQKNYSLTGNFGKFAHLTMPGRKMLELYDPQFGLDSVTLKSNRLTAKLIGVNSLAFVRIQQGAFTWWQAVDANAQFTFDHVLPEFNLGTSPPVFDKIDLSSFFNDKVTNIFKHQYLSPRPVSPTLQLPTQGIGNWCYPLVTAVIDDYGTRKKAEASNEIISMDKIPFRTPADSNLNNIVFTSQWDNFPDSAVVPLSGKASWLHLLMAGTTNPMQSRITNGLVVIKYTDGSTDQLDLDNPYGWFPIEQDYYTDEFAFTAGFNIPERLYLKEGRFAQGLDNYTSIKGFTNRAIDGGAANVFRLSLDENKTLQSLTVHAIANDVVIGLMAITLER
jgi:hypothetical protein